MKRPFLLIPWDTDFLSELHRRINEATDGRAERAVVVFPHDRPRRYLLEAFRSEGRALILPRMLTVRELFAGLRPSGGARRPLREAGLIDRIALLYACCRDAARPDEDLHERLLRGGEAAFFPWGERLADLLEECLVQHIAPTDLHHAEAEVAPFGADLLAALGRIFRLYAERLPERGRTTPGLDAFMVASDLENWERMPPLLRDKAVFLAGFHTLTGAEERVFRHLWERGAHILLHSDPALKSGSGEAVHWACAGHSRWIAKWRARVELACAPSGRAPRLHFFSGYDLHSQLGQLAADLDEDAVKGAPSMAVTLTHPELLLPVLHHLPRKDCNISLGYPFERTLLYRLIDLILRLAEQRLEDGRAPWRELAELACHPWLRLLRPEGEDAAEDGDGTAAEGMVEGESESKVDVGPSRSFAALLRLLDQEARRGGRFQDPEATAAAALRQAASRKSSLGRGAPDAALAALLERVLEQCLHRWSRAESLEDMAACLAGLAELLGERGRELWRRFPLDAECLTRLVQRVIPPLRDNDLAAGPLPIPLRHSLLRTLLRAERVPFEADPITGLQVLGMLETRLLRFSRVFVVDATDDSLPGPPPHDPLLPDSLRGVLGLPDGQHRDQLAAHTFHRLLAGADEVFLYWQEGVQPSGLLDTARQRSRLVEELIWREEQRAGRLLEPGRPPLRRAAPRLVPPRRQRLSLARTPLLHARMAEVLADGLTTGRLDAYLTCPLAFYYGYVAGLSVPDEVNEGDDPAGVGELLHAVLRDAYTPWLHTSVRREEVGATLDALFHSQLGRTPHLADLPPESAVMLELAGPERLRRYVRSQPETTIVRCLEQDLRAPCFPSEPDSPVLRGRLDRVDEREGAIILDYKTGRLRTIAPDLWADEELWARLELWLSDPAGGEEQWRTGDELLLELADRAPSVQLPGYIQLYRSAKASGLLVPTMSDVMPDVMDAAWVDLGEQGREHALFGPDMDDETRQTAIDAHIPRLLAFVIRHMREAPHFHPREGAHCGWCLFKNLCMIIE